MRLETAPTELTSLYRQGLLIRGVEQKLLELFSRNKLFGTVHTCIGQEISALAVAQALRKEDLVFSNHRCHGHFLAKTGDVDGLIAELMGRQTGVCGGRGGSQHLCSEGFFSNGIQGGIVPVAAGLALSLKLRRPDAIAVVFVGDGTLGEGAFYEALNIASKWELPLLVVLEDNLYAQSTAQHETLAGDIQARATAFGIRAMRGDIWDHRTLFSRAAEAVDYVRRRRVPLFLQIGSYRLMAHSKGDDNRDPAEVKSHWDKDPLQRFVLDCPEEAAPIQASVAQVIETAVARAEAAPPTAASERDPDEAGWRPCAWRAVPALPKERVVTLLHDAFQRNIRRDSRILMLGEDVEGPYGGAFKVTKNLSREFPGRVRNTPISEAAIVGLGNGLALEGFIPVVEIMFGDFLTLAADQLINHAAKFRYMYNDRVRVPLVVRTPMGGKRGYGPTHSQSLEKHFLGLPGTLMLALNARVDPGEIYDTLFASIDRPTIVIENKLLYGALLPQEAPAGFAWERSDERYPTTRLRPASAPDLTILCYGGMMPEAEAAVQRLFEEYEVACEILCPTQLYPFNAWPLVESVKRSGRLLVVEEGIGFASLAAEAVAQVVEAAPGALRRIKRLAARPHPIPSSLPLEKMVLPAADDIVREALPLLEAA